MGLELSEVGTAGAEIKKRKQQGLPRVEPQGPTKALPKKGITPISILQR